MFTSLSAVGHPRHCLSATGMHTQSSLPLFGTRYLIECQKVSYTLYIASKSVLHIQLIAICNPGVTTSPAPDRRYRHVGSRVLETASRSRGPGTSSPLPWHWSMRTQRKLRPFVKRRFGASPRTYRPTLQSTETQKAAWRASTKPDASMYLVTHNHANGSQFNF